MTNQVSKIEQSISAKSSEVLNKKLAWAEVGEIVHNTNLELGFLANNLKGRLVPPTELGEVNEAEKTLKEVNAELTKLEDQRKEVTNRFAKVTSSLMIHEKSVKEATLPFYQAILSLKQAEEKRVNAEKAKIEAAGKLKEAYIKHINETWANWRTKVNNICLAAYEHALGDGNITIAKIEGYLKTVKRKKFDVKEFVLEIPANLDKDKWDLAIASTGMITPEEFLEFAHGELDRKFEFYGAALKNKAGAIAHAKEKAEEEKAQIATNLQTENVATTLEVLAETASVVVTSDVKELKKKYELDMPDDERSAILIMTAFLTNYKAVKDGVRVTSWKNLKIEQMGNALAWLKNKDDAFEFGEIKFKKTDKI